MLQTILRMVFFRRKKKSKIAINEVEIAKQKAIIELYNELGQEGFYKNINFLKLVVDVHIPDRNMVDEAIDRLI